jgi:hypothetical protein
MADNQTYYSPASAKEAPASGKEAPEVEKPKLVGVIEQLLKALSDKVLSMEKAVKENTVQLHLMEECVKTVGSIPERIEAVEQRLKASGEETSRTGERAEVLELSVRKSMDSSKRLDGAILSLEDRLGQHAALFEKPLQKTVHYRHFIGKPVFVIVVLCLLCAGLVSLCVQYYEKADRYGASDIQWRSALQIQDSVTLNELQLLKQNYAANPDSIRRLVIEEEERRAALAERVIEMNHKMQEVDELKKQRKAH